MVAPSTPTSAPSYSPTRRQASAGSDHRARRLSGVAVPRRAGPPRMVEAVARAPSRRARQAARSDSVAGRASSMGASPNAPPPDPGRAFVALDGTQLVGPQALEPANHLRRAERVVIGQDAPDDFFGRGIGRER